MALPPTCNIIEQQFLNYFYGFSTFEWPINHLDYREHPQYSFKYSYPITLVNAEEYVFIRSCEYYSNQVFKTVAHFLKEMVSSAVHYPVYWRYK